MLNRELLELEEQGAAAPDELVNNAFRAIHTIKGLSGMLGLSQINRLSHSMEDVLAGVRRGDLHFAGGLAGILFEFLDLLSEMVEATSAGASDAQHHQEVHDAIGKIRQVVEAAKGPGDPGPDEAPEQGSGEPKGTEPSKAPKAPEKEKKGNYKGQTSQAIRVDVEKLDRILALVGELVISRSRYAHLAGQAVSRLSDIGVASRNVIGLQTELTETESVMSRTLTELQDAVMKARLVPMGSVFGRFRRLVRDLASQTGQWIRFESTGGETELDKKVIDQIGDPLMHLIRNAVDHGIETPQEREIRGKPEQGCITLSARQEGDRIVIEVTDDGRGLDRERIVKKALDRGLLSPEKAAEVTGQEMQEIISAPGFSTAKEVTDLSGRGVGMDVVQETLANLKGTLEIQSRPGEGTTFRIELPLTMAIVDSLLVAVNQERYAIAVSSVKEILEISHDAIHSVGKKECFQSKGRVLPLIRLVAALDTNGSGEADGGNGRGTTVLVDSDDGDIGLMVDRVIGQQEIVIKALSRRFENVHEISGGSVLGDGSVCLILDVRALVAKARGVVSELAGVEA